MTDRTIHARDAAKSRRCRTTRPAFEGLEERLLLYAVTGDHFTYGARITWSVVPDGTSLGGNPSNLIATLNSEVGPTATWLPYLQDAFAQWENVANINLVQVNDSGLPTESGNIQQGSPQFGDIRIGGFAQGGGTLAFTLLPPGANGGSDSGDIFLNTGQSWSPQNGYDLETVMVHEIGHALGLGHSASPYAVMYPYYGGVEQAPNTDDVAGVQAIWGARQEDGVEKLNGNTAPANAPELSSFIVPSTGQAYLPGLDVASPSEAYWFKVTTPANASNVLTARVQSWQLSELSPRVVVFDASLHGLVQTTSAANVYGGLVDATITNATPSTTYYIKVLGSTALDSGTGAYALIINTGNQATTIASPTINTVSTQPDQGGGALTETLNIGGVGNWIKAWALSGEKLRDFSPIGFEPDRHLSSTLDSISRDLASIGDDAVDVLNEALVGLLQEIPGGLMDGSALDLGQSSGTGQSGSISTGKLQSILSRFFSDLESVLDVASINNKK